MSKYDGGSAFPSPGVSVSDGRGDQMQQGSYEGMSLRDYFAAKAMQGICMHPDTWGLVDAEIVVRAYQIADAMIAERSK